MIAEGKVHTQVIEHDSPQGFSAHIGTPEGLVGHSMVFQRDYRSHVWDSRKD